MELIPYGNRSLKINLQGNKYTVIKPEIIRPEIAQSKIVEKSLINGLIISPTSSHVGDLIVSIGINDQSRPIPNHILLPRLLKRLNHIGLKPKNIRFFIATGTHTPLKPDEFSTILDSNILSKYQVYCHDCDNEQNMKYLGTSNAGTPVFVNRQFMDSDIKILVGNIESHHFMGFSGGVKTAAIGLSTRETITANHSILSHPNAVMGLFSTNPMRQDVEEIGKMIGIDFVLNVVINDEKEIISAFCGNPVEVMAKGIEFIRNKVQMDINNSAAAFDLVIASPGGYPKDINFYQAQKAITHACLFSKPGGVIILAAECRDGIGSERFEHFLLSNGSFPEIIRAFESMQFEIGPHKAYQLAKQAINHRIILISDIDDEVVRKMHLMPANSIEQALELSKNNLPEYPNIAVLPYATHTMPKISEIL